MNVISRVLTAATGTMIFGSALAQSSAAPGGSSGDTIQEIVVTAQRREENMQSVPIAISAVTAIALKDRNIDRVDGLNSVVPSLLVQPIEATVTVSLRGFGTAQSSVGSQPAVPVYIDGIYSNRLLPIQLQLNNLSRVEVLKGPQGTLFGRNSEGGAIQLVTRDPKPGDPLSVDLQAGYSSFDTADTKVYASSSFGSSVAGDFAAVYHNQNQGWGVNLFNGRQAWLDKSYALRSKWVFHFGDSTRAILTAGMASQNSDIGMAGTYDSDIYPSGYGVNGLPNGSGLLPRPPGSRYNVYNNFNNAGGSRTNAAALRIEQDLPFATLVNITAYNNYKATFLNDLDQTITSDFELDQVATGHQFSDELQLISAASGPMQWTAGLFFLSDAQGYPFFHLFGNTTFGPGNTLNIYGNEETKSYAAYAQLTAPVPFVDGLNLTLGGRYSKDKVAASGGQDFITAAGTVPLAPYDAASKSFQKTTYRVSLDYNLADHVLMYASNNLGYRAGQFNLDAFDPHYVNPETINAWELGIKSNLFEDRVRLNAATFLYNISNLQVQQDRGSTSFLVNAGKSKVKGVEFDSEGRLFHGLTFRAGAAYVNAKYVSFPDAPIYGINTAPPYGLPLPVAGDAAGKSLTRAPQVTGNVGLNYKVPFQSGDLDFDINYSHTGRFYWDPDNLVQQKSYGLLDGKVSYALPSGITLSFWGRNLTNSFYFVSEFEVTGPAGLTGGPGAPRTFGAIAEYAF